MSAREDRFAVVVDEYVWLHEVCGMPEWQVAKALRIELPTLHEYLRRTGHARPEKTLRAADDLRRSLTTQRAKVGTR